MTTDKLSETQVPKARENRVNWVRRDLNKRGGGVDGGGIEIGRGGDREFREDEGGERGKNWGFNGKIE